MDLDHSRTDSPNAFLEAYLTSHSTPSDIDTFKGSSNLLLGDRDQYERKSLSIVAILRSASFELFSLLVAGGSLAVLVVLLSRLNGKERPTWYLGPLSVSINPIVSVVSTIFRAGLMVAVSQNLGQACWLRYTKPRSLEYACCYDRGSRGSLPGCVALLKKLRLREFASLGAFITMLSLALDPFFQQSVGYSSMAIEDSTGVAESVTAHTYDSGADLLGTYNSSSFSLPYNIKAAMYSGLLSSNFASLPNPPFNCPTGNCTWEPFDTLAVGSKCVNITSHVEPNCTYSWEFDDSCVFQSTTDPVLQRMLRYLDPTYRFIINSIAINDLDNATLAVLQPYANASGFLAMTQWVKATGEFSNSDPSVGGIIYRKTTFEAGRCFFYLSVQRINVTVRNGEYSEKIIHEWTQAQNDQAIPTYTSNGTNYYFRNVSQYNDYFLFGSSLPQPIVYKTPANTARPMFNNTFVVPWDTYMMFASQLTENGFLNGTAISIPLWGGSADVPIMLYQAQNVTTSMHSLAAYMTIALRANDTQTLPQSESAAFKIARSQVVTGTAWMQKQIVTVRWEFLYFPSSLLLLAFILLVATYREARRCQVGLWKSSPLALFFHGRLQNGSSNIHWNLNSLDTEKEMKKAASGLYAKLTPGGEVMEVWESN